jgi:hypothetical protein
MNAMRGDRARGWVSGRKLSRVNNGARVDLRARLGPSTGVLYARRVRAAMFSLSFDSTHRVLLAQFAGVLSSEDINGLDKALAAFVSRHGFTPGIVDFSAIEANAVPQSFFKWRARLPQILLGQERIIVAPQQEIHELACAYAAQQRDSGNVEPQVVRALSEAYRILDLDQADFRPVT